MKRGYLTRNYAFIKEGREGKGMDREEFSIDSSSDPFFLLRAMRYLCISSLPDL